MKLHDEYDSHVDSHSYIQPILYESKAVDKINAAQSFTYPALVTMNNDPEYKQALPAVIFIDSGADENIMYLTLAVKLFGEEILKDMNKTMTIRTNIGDSTVMATRRSIRFQLLPQSYDIDQEAVFPSQEMDVYITTVTDPLFGEDIVISGFTALQLRLIQMIANPSDNALLIDKSSEYKDDWKGVDESNDDIDDTTSSFPTNTCNNSSDKELKSLVDATKLELPKISEDFKNKEALIKLLQDYSKVFDSDISQTNLMSSFSMDIQLIPDAPVIKSKARNIPPKLLQYVRDEVKRLLDSGIIVKSQSNYASPIVMKQKEPGVPGVYRMCIDYTKMNNITVSMAHPLPNINSIFHDMEHHEYYAKFDLRSGYHQLNLKEDVRFLSAFITPDGLYEFNRVPFGMKNAPSVFQKALEEILSDYIPVFCRVYIDDIIVYADDEEQLIERIRLILKRLDECNVRLKGSKCMMGQKEIIFLGHIVNSQGHKLDPDKVERVLEYPTPTTVKKLRTFLGRVNVFHHYIPALAEHIKPFYELIPLDNPIKWTDKLEEKFQAVKKMIADAGWLKHITYSHPLVLKVDASDVGIGGVLGEVYETEGFQPIQFFSQAFSPVQLRWSTIEKEAYAIFYGVTKLSSFLLGQHFTIETDHRNLVYMHKATAPKIVRWKLRLQEFDFTIHHIPGAMNNEADSLSRFARRQLLDSDIDNNSVDVLKENKDFNDNKVQLVVTDNNKSLLNKPEYISNDMTPAVVHSADQLYDEVDYESDTYQDTDDITIEDNKIPAIQDNDEAADMFIPALPPISEEQKREIFHTHHNAVVGHLGSVATCRSIREHNQLWYNYRNDITDYIKHCPICQKVWQGRENIIAAIKTIRHLEPFELIAIDTLKVSEDIHGNKYVFAIVDSFSRYIELEPSESCDSKGAAQALLKTVCRYGPPKYIQSDQGTEFVNGVIKSLLEWFKVQHNQTLAYHPQSNGQIERANRTILRHLRGLVLEKEVTTRWSDFLPLVQRIMNMTYSNEIGTTPTRLLFGDAIAMNRGLLEPFRDNELLSISTADYVDELNMNLSKIIESTKKRQQDFIRHRIEQSPKEPTKFQEGDFVLVDYIARPPSKTMCPWRGPMAVMGNKDNIYYCQDLQTNKITAYDISRLKKFYLDDEPNSITPMQLSALDEDLKFVEEIIDHDGSPKKRTQMQFLVKWKDLPEEENSFIPWKEAHELAALDKYIERHPELACLNEPACNSAKTSGSKRKSQGRRDSRRGRGRGQRGSRAYSD